MGRERRPSGAGISYSGSQGDLWDAQKDMASAFVGSALAMIFTLVATKGIRKKAPHTARS